MKIILSLCFAILLAGCAPALTPVPSPVEESPTPAATWTPVPPFIFLFLQVVDIAIHFNDQSRHVTIKIADKSLNNLLPPKIDSQLTRP